MNWYKIRNRRINMDTGFWYEPSRDIKFKNYTIYKEYPSISFKGDEIRFDTKEERDEELRKLDEALEKGLHTLSEFKLP